MIVRVFPAGVLSARRPDKGRAERDLAYERDTGRRLHMLGHFSEKEAEGSATGLCCFRVLNFTYLLGGHKDIYILYFY